MTKRASISDYRAQAAAVADVDALDMFGAPQGRTSLSARRVGMILFWSAVACLLLARVALFDPNATRPVGSFAEQIAPLHSTR